MKKIVIIINMIFLCSILCTAEETLKLIDQETYNQWVNYVICKSAKEYIDAINNNQPEYKDYRKILMPKLDSASLVSSLDIKTLVDILQSYEWKNTASYIHSADSILKSRYKANMPIDTVFSWFSERCESHLQRYIYKNVTILKNIVKTDKTLEAQIDTLKEKIKNIEDRLEKNKNQIYVLGGAVCLLLLIMIVKFFVYRKRSVSSSLNKTIQGIDSTKEDVNKERECFNNDDIVQIINKQIDTKLEGKLIIMDGLLENIEIIIEEKVRNKITKIWEKEDDIQDESGVIYLKEKRRDNGETLLFKETTKENAYYKVFDINDKHGKYEFCGDEEKALENYHGVLENVFDDKGTYSSKAKNIDSIKHGTVIKKESLWEIETFAVINYS